MFDWGRLLIHGAIYSTIASIVLLVGMAINPRFYLQDYPEPIQKMVPPKTEKEKKQGIWVGLAFMLVLLGGNLLSTWLVKQAEPNATYWQLAMHAFGISFFFNLVDLVILDWLLFCTVQPAFMIIPGTESAQAYKAGYKDYMYHFRAALTGAAISLVSGLLFGGIIWLL